MARCLERVLASDYKKLEVVVFDDSSNDNTSIIIRSFAQAGVRFVAGKELPEGWLGKNYALDVLSREASGTYVVLMHVDTALEPKTLSKLVAHMEAEKLTMLSVIPERADGWRMSVLFGYLRYFWELAVRTRRSPATSGALWMINRRTLIKDLGGLEPLKATAAPESAVAAALGPEKYQCLISGDDLGVTFEKKWSSQIESSRRLLYPKIGGTHLGAVGASIAMLLLNFPIVALCIGFVLEDATLRLVSAGVLALGMFVFGTYTKHMWRRAWWFGALLWPLVILQELIVLFASFIGYYRHTITWKGRPVSPSPFPRQARSQ